MTIVALAAILLSLLAIGVAATVTGVARSAVREHARERQLLVNQILHLSGRTWTPPPAGERVQLTNPDTGLLRSPEQLPEHEWDD